MRYNIHIHTYDTYDTQQHTRGRNEISATTFPFLSGRKSRARRGIEIQISSENYNVANETRGGAHTARVIYFGESEKKKFQRDWLHFCKKKKKEKQN